MIASLLSPRRDTVTDAAPARLVIGPPTNIHLRSSQPNYAASWGGPYAPPPLPEITAGIDNATVAPYAGPVLMQEQARADGRWGTRRANPGMTHASGAGQPRRCTYEGVDVTEWLDAPLACSRCGDPHPRILVEGDALVCGRCSLRAASPTPVGEPIATVRAGSDLLSLAIATDAEALVAVGSGGALLRDTGAVDGWAVLRQLAHAAAHHVPPIVVCMDETGAADSIAVYRGEGSSEWLRWWDCHPDGIRL